MCERAIDEAEDAVLSRACAGDRSALAAVLRHHRGAIERICARMCAASDVHADDVVQDTYLGIVCNIASFRGEASFLTWAYTIARTAFGRQQRRAKLACKLDALAVVSTATTAPANERPPDELVSTRELGAALATLSATDRQVLLMRDLEGWSAREVAARTGLTVPAVKTRLHRARMAMRSRWTRPRRVGVARCQGV